MLGTLYPPSTPRRNSWFLTPGSWFQGLTWPRLSHCGCLRIKVSLLPSSALPCSLFSSPLCFFYSLCYSCLKINIFLNNDFRLQLRTQSGKIALKMIIAANQFLFSHCIKTPVLAFNIKNFFHFRVCLFSTMLISLSDRTIINYFNL